MAVTTFAAIDIGSYNVSMEIFELTKKSGLRSLTRVRQGLELGSDTFALRKISMERLEELTKILLDYRRIMKEYGVSGYRACAKSAFREAGNRYLAVDHIKRAAGIEIDPKTRGPKVDAAMATSMPGVFAGGNVVRVYDLVDWVSRDSEIAGRSAAKYALDLH